MKSPLKSCLLVFAVFALLSNACGVTRAPVAATPPPAAADQASHEVYAGFTEDSAMPFFIVHDTGESFVITQDAGSSTVTGGVWQSADGKSLVIYSDANGRPVSAVVGDSMVFYSNYTDQSVDLTVVQPDGTSTTIQVPLDTELLRKITSFVPPTTRRASFASSGFHRQTEMDGWFWMKTGLYMMSVASCVGGVAGGAVTGGLALLFLANTCTGAILGTVSRVGTILHMDVGFVDSLGDLNSGVGCTMAVGETIQSKIPTQHLKACAKLIVQWAEEDSRSARFLSENPVYTGLQQGTIPFEPVLPQAQPGTYYTNLPYAMSYPGWSITLDHVQVMEDGNVMIVNVWVNTNSVCDHQGDCDLMCSTENDDANARMLFPDGSLATALETNCTGARGQSFIVNPGETFSDWAIFPPLKDASLPFSIDWYTMGTASNIQVPVR